jgi:uncharacterized protein YceK
MKTGILLIAAVAVLSGCATAVAIVDVTASTAVYATKAVATTTYKVVSYPFKEDED